MKTLYYTRGNNYCVLAWDAEEHEDLGNYIDTRHPNRVAVGVRTPVWHEKQRKRTFKIAEMDVLVEEVKILGYKLIPY